MEGYIEYCQELMELLNYKDQCHISLCYVQSYILQCLFLQQHHQHLQKLEIKQQLQESKQRVNQTLLKQPYKPPSSITSNKVIPIQISSSSSTTSTPILQKIQMMKMKQQMQRKLKVTPINRMFTTSTPDTQSLPNNTTTTNSGILETHRQSPLKTLLSSKNRNKRMYENDADDKRVIKLRKLKNIFSDDDEDEDEDEEDGVQVNKKGKKNLFGVMSPLKTGNIFHI